MTRRILSLSEVVPGMVVTVEKEGGDRYADREVGPYNEFGSVLGIYTGPAWFSLANLSRQGFSVSVEVEDQKPGCSYCGGPREFVDGGEWAGWRCANHRCVGWRTQENPRENTLESDVGIVQQMLGFRSDVPWPSLDRIIKRALEAPDPTPVVEVEETPEPEWTLEVAMMGTTDGGLIEPESDIPIGEAFRLASEWVEWHDRQLAGSEAQKIADRAIEKLRERYIVNPSDGGGPYVLNFSQREIEAAIRWAVERVFVKGEKK